MTSLQKLRSLDKAVAYREALRREGKNVVLTNGVFDLLHPGHLYSLTAAAKFGALFVALNSDRSVKELKGPSRPIEDEKTRAAKLASLPYVDSIVIFDKLRLTDEIRALKPDVYCKSGDYTLDKLDAGERAALQEAGARIEFIPFLPGHSTTALIAARKK